MTLPPTFAGAVIVDGGGATVETRALASGRRLFVTRLHGVRATLPDGTRFELRTTDPWGLSVRVYGELVLRPLEAEARRQLAQAIEARADKGDLRGDHVYDALQQVSLGRGLYGFERSLERWGPVRKPWWARWPAWRRLALTSRP